MADPLPKHGLVIVALQVIFIVLFGIFVRYHPNAATPLYPMSDNHTEQSMREHHVEADPDEYIHQKTYPMFQDVHVMIFIGFGFLMTFLKRYGFSAVGLNFLVAATTLQWAILVNGFFHLHHGVILIDVNSLIGADFTAAAVLISFGAVLGKTTPLQLVVMTVIEVPIFVINEVVGRKHLGAIDMGDSMFVHAFGAYFGLAVSLMLFRRDGESSKEGSSYTSDVFAMIGTVFLWVFWPSFNGGAAPGSDQHRAFINTYIALSACCLSAFALSSIVDPHRKLNMVHIQNSTLAGGVAIGTASDLMIDPWGAALVGFIAGIISVCGYAFLTPLLASKLHIHDTCGVHNLHGMPAVLAGIVGSVMATLASEETYGVRLYKIFPALSPQEGTERLKQLQQMLPDLEPGDGITAAQQGTYQILALLITVGIAVVGGIITGIILRLGPLHTLSADELYDDTKFWLLEEGGDDESRSSEPIGISLNVQSAKNQTP